MLSNKEIRALSREQLRGNWLKFALINLVMLILAGGCSYLAASKQITGLSLIQVLIQAFIGLGMFRLLLDIAKGKGFNFSNFRQPGRVYLRYILACILLLILIMAVNLVIGFILSIVGFSMLIGGMQTLTNMSFYTLPTPSAGAVIGFIILTLLALVINIFIELTYELVGLIIVENNDDVGAIDSLAASRKLMKGYKWRLFKLNLSFIGWGILCIFTVGIGFLWLVTYINMSTVNFYRELLKEREELAKDLHLAEPVVVSASNVYTGESQAQISGVEEVKTVEVAPVESTEGANLEDSTKAEDSNEDSEK
ncbi:DUF975 family protein [Peptostreptococcus stomatis]|uniref:DUF975 family protein n=1 Tax=Peptostreptococcus stomatis TaxID=341694 RepID=UPI0028DCE777|nr:DUF975 family protein [Peptostreptococcus stomatis]